MMLGFLPRAEKEMLQGVFLILLLEDIEKKWLKEFFAKGKILTREEEKIAEEKEEKRDEEGREKKEKVDYGSFNRKREEKTFTILFYNPAYDTGFEKGRVERINVTMNFESEEEKAVGLALMAETSFPIDLYVTQPLIVEREIGKKAELVKEGELDIDNAKDDLVVASPVNIEEAYRRKEKIRQELVSIIERLDRIKKALKKGEKWERISPFLPPFLRKALERLREKGVEEELLLKIIERKVAVGESLLNSLIAMGVKEIEGKAENIIEERIKAIIKAIS